MDEEVRCELCDLPITAYEGRCPSNLLAPECPLRQQVCEELAAWDRWATTPEHERGPLWYLI